MFRLLVSSSRSLWTQRVTSRALVILHVWHFNIHVREFQEISSLGSSLKFVEEFILIYPLSNCYYWVRFETEEIVVELNIIIEQHSFLFSSFTIFWCLKNINQNMFQTYCQDTEKSHNVSRVKRGNKHWKYFLWRKPTVTNAQGSFRLLLFSCWYQSSRFLQ